MTTARCTLPPDVASVAAARHYVEKTLSGWGVDEASWTCVQLVSELATNAVIHARTEFVIEVSRHADVLRVCVQDTSQVPPGLRRYAEDSTTGRGLRLVESMSSNWGVSTASLGKVIWFEIDLSRRGTVESWDDGTEIDLHVLLDEFGDEEDRGAVTASVAARPLRRVGLASSGGERAA